MNEAMKQTCRQKVASYPNTDLLISKEVEEGRRLEISRFEMPHLNLRDHFSSVQSWISSFISNSI